MRNQWKYATHLATLDNGSWAKQLVLSSFTLKEDPYALYSPFRCAGRPHMRWDGYLRSFFSEHFPADYERHWLSLLEDIGPNNYEDMYVDFVMRTN